MTFPAVTVPNTFQSQTGPIPLSQLDANFSALQTAANYFAYAAKSASTARASTATLSNDPELIYAIPAAGTYKIELYLYLSYVLSTVATGGYSFNLNYSGSFTSGIGGSTFVNEGGNTSQGQGLLIQSSAATSAFSYAPGLSPNAYASNFTITGVLVATGTGTLGLSWAQAISNATATTLYAGSYLAVTRIL